MDVSLTNTTIRTYHHHIIGIKMTSLTTEKLEAAWQCLHQVYREVLASKGETRGRAEHRSDFEKKYPDTVHRDVAEAACAWYNKWHKEDLEKEDEVYDSSEPESSDDESDDSSDEYDEFRQHKNRDFD